MSKQVRTMVNQLVDWYAERIDGIITLTSMKNIPESDYNNIAAMMLSQNDDLAAEASGPDNDEFYKSILPAMIKALKMPKNGFENEEFRDVYKSAIRSYVMPKIFGMITERLNELNEDNGCHTSLIWNRESEKVVELYI